VGRRILLHRFGITTVSIFKVLNLKCYLTSKHDKFYANLSLDARRMKAKEMELNLEELEMAGSSDSSKFLSGM